MGLADDLNDPSNFLEPIRMKCKLCELLKELKEEDKEALIKRLEDPRVGHTALSDVLMKNGYNVSRSSVSRHRKDTHVLK